MSTLTLAALATLVFCAPGYPGGAGDGQPYVDQFAKAAIASAGWKPDSLAAIYDPSDQGSLAKLGDPDSVLAFMPYAFYISTPQSCTWRRSPRPTSWASAPRSAGPWSGRPVARSAVRHR